VLQEWNLQTSSPGRLSGLEDLEDMARPMVVPSNGPGGIPSNSAMACRCYAATKPPDEFARPSYVVMDIPSMHVHLATLYAVVMQLVEPIYSVKPWQLHRMAL